METEPHLKVHSGALLGRLITSHSLSVRKPFPQHISCSFLLPFSYLHVAILKIHFATSKLASQGFILCSNNTDLQGFFSTLSELTTVQNNFPDTILKGHHRCIPGLDLPRQLWLAQRNTNNPKLIFCPYSRVTVRCSQTILQRPHSAYRSLDICYNTSC